MARKARLENEGGLYHVITRGNARQDMSATPEKQRTFAGPAPFFLQGPFPKPNTRNRKLGIRHQKR